MSTEYLLKQCGLVSRQRLWYSLSKSNEDQDLFGLTRTKGSRLPHRLLPWRCL